MKAIKTEKTTIDYKGPTKDIGDLPCWRENIEGTNVILSVWEPSDDERELIAKGYNVELGIWGMEPIPPVSVNITDLKRKENA